MRIAFVLLGVLLLALVALFVVRPGGDDGDESPAEVTVGEIVDTPPLWYRKPVVLQARAIHVDDERFLLEGERRTIIVRPEPDAVQGVVEAGERVEVRGVVSRLDRLQASELRGLLGDGGRPQLDAAPTKLGDPYVSAGRVDARG